MERSLNNLELAKTSTSPELLDIIFVKGTLEEKIEVIRNSHTGLKTLLKAVNSISVAVEVIAREKLKREYPEYLLQLYGR